MGALNGKKQDRPTDYDTYEMSVREKVFYTAAAAIVLYLAGLVFYRNPVLSAVLCIPAFFYHKIKIREIIRKRKKELNLQFKDMLYALSSSVSAGRSLESAFKDILNDLAILYPSDSVYIVKEVRYIARKIDMNETVEAAIADFANRSHLEDVENFADVLQTCKRTGGNIVEVIKNATSIINDKIEIKQEIETLLAERKIEQKVLNVVPIGMILLLSVSAGDFISPVFHTGLGRIAMTASILLLAAAFFVSKRIMDIKV